MHRHRESLLESPIDIHRDVEMLQGGLLVATTTWQDFLFLAIFAQCFPAFSIYLSGLGRELRTHTGRT